MGFMAAKAPARRKARLTEARTLREHGAEKPMGDGFRIRILQHVTVELRAIPDAHVKE